MKIPGFPDVLLCCCAQRMAIHPSWGMRLFTCIRMRARSKEKIAPFSANASTRAIHLWRDPPPTTTSTHASSLSANHPDFQQTTLQSQPTAARKTAQKAVPRAGAGRGLTYPWFLCEFALEFSTLKTVLSSSTPWRHQLSSVPDLVGAMAQQLCK